ncbi:MAG: hypothetical protein L3J46_04155, partial [Kangiellaceae bacterium]|nr:hypothetical protein [Kangiellaceae bacterium]
HCSYRLAITGAIKDTVIEYDDIAYYAVEYLRQFYPERLTNTYNIEELFDDTTELLESMGRKRGCIQSGGRVDLDRICKILIHEYRNFTLGMISLETPAMIEKELVEVEELLRLKAEKDETRKKKKKRRR